MRRRKRRLGVRLSCEVPSCLAGAGVDLAWKSPRAGRPRPPRGPEFADANANVHAGVVGEHLSPPSPWHPLCRRGHSWINSGGVVEPIDESRGLRALGGAVAGIWLPVVVVALLNAHGVIPVAWIVASRRPLVSARQPTGRVPTASGDCVR